MPLAVYLHANALKSKHSVVSLKDLSALDTNEQEIQVRGFAYKKTDGQWILSAEPALKSCCVGSRAKAKEQIILIGDIPTLSYAQAIVVQGKLHTHTTENMLYYTLSEARVISETSFPWLTLCVMVGLALLAGASSYFLKKTQKN